MDRGQGRRPRGARTPRLPDHRAGATRARVVAARLRNPDRASRRVASAPVLRRRPAARRGARAARGAPGGLPRHARVPAEPRRRERRAGSAVHRPRLPVGPRLLRVGDRVVRAAGTALAARGIDDPPPPTWRLLLSRGLPQFAGEAVVPVLVFYAGWRVAGLAPAVVAST